MIQLMGDPSVGRQQLGKCGVDSNTTEEIKGTTGTEFLEALDAAISDGQDKEVDPNGLIAQLIALDLLPGPMPDQSIEIGKLGFDSNSMMTVGISPSHVAQVLAENYNSSTGEFDLAGVVKGLSEFGLPFGAQDISALNEVISQRAVDLGSDRDTFAQIQNALQEVKLDGDKYQVRLVQEILSLTKQKISSGSQPPIDLSDSNSTKKDISGLISGNPNATKIPAPIPRPNLEPSSKAEALAASQKKGTSRSAEYGSQSRPVPKQDSGYQVPTGESKGGRRDLLLGKQPHVLSKQEFFSNRSLFFGQAKVLENVGGNSPELDLASSLDVTSLNEFASKFASTHKDQINIQASTQVAVAEAAEVQPIVLSQLLREPMVATELSDTGSAKPINKAGKSINAKTENPVGKAILESEDAASDEPVKVSSDLKIDAAIKKGNSAATKFDTEQEIDLDNVFKQENTADRKLVDEVMPPTHAVVGKMTSSKAMNASQLERADTAVLNHANEVAEAVSDLIASRRPSSIKIELNPQDLGTIEVAVRQVGHRADVDLRASDEGVRQSLQTHRQELVQSIESKGTSLGSLNVGHHDGNQAQQQGQNHRDSMRESLNQAAHLSQFGTTTETQPMAQPSYRSSHTGRVDYAA
ncbi:MAG: flagellar hook-length control protein FliK [Fimbriimonadaceae bacterium]|nr:MAG: flagellar hook-length control protein FliK [Fimbriimonadaceae bacterium]